MTLEPPAAGTGRNDVPAAPDWRDELSAGRFGSAHRAYLVSGGHDTAVRSTLSALSDVEALVRAKAWHRATKRLAQIEGRPPLVPWSRLQGDLERLRRSGDALDRRRPDDAVAELDALESGLFEAEAQTQRGTALIYDDRVDDAERCFQQALEADPRHFRALTNLGNIALEQGRVDEAIAAYERALALNDTFANAHHNLAVAYRRKGQLGKSVHHLRRAQRLMQRNDADDARARLGSLAGGRRLPTLRWLMYAAAAIVLYLLLKSRGVL